jgi:uncharacterized protein (TIGR03435 family)
VTALRLTLFFAMLTPAWGQALSPTEFEVASIKPAQFISAVDLRTGKSHVGMKIFGSQVDIRLTSLLGLIAKAYRIDRERINGVPSTGLQSWDILAKLPAGGSRDQVPEMLQALLAERFKLSVHLEQKEQPVYALTIGPGGAKLQSSPPAASRKNQMPRGNLTADYESGDTHIQSVLDGKLKYVYLSSPEGDLRLRSKDGATYIEGDDVSTGKLADFLKPLLDRPVIDSTNLTGRFDMVFELPIDSYPGGAQLSSGELNRRLERMGLKLESRRAPIQTLVVDRVEKYPSEN